MSKNKKIIFAIILCGLVLTLAPSLELVEAAGLKNPLGTTSISKIISRVIKAVLGVVGAVALLMFIYGGFMWLTSGGATERIKKGRDTLLWATIGLLIIFLSYTLVNFLITGITTGITPEGGKAPESTAKKEPPKGTCACGGEPTTDYTETQKECTERSKKWYKPCKWSKN